MMYVRVGEERICVHRYGPENAPEILLITGFIGEAAFWEKLVPLLSGSYRVTVFDQRGTGDSGRFEVPLSMEQMANDVAYILSDVISAPVHLIGHSAGCGVSMILANNYPDRVRSVSLLAGWTKADAWMHRVFDVRLEALRNSGEMAYASLTTLFMTPSQDVSQHHIDIIKAEAAYGARMPSVGDIKARARAVLDFDASQWATGVQCPSLVLGARDDMMTPYYFSTQLADTMPDVRLKGLESGGHYFPRTRPSETANALKTFLVGVECGEDICVRVPPMMM